MKLSDCERGAEYSVYDNEEGTHFTLLFKSAESYKAMSNKMVWVYTFVVYDPGNSGMTCGEIIELDDIDVQDNLLTLSKCAPRK